MPALVTHTLPTSSLRRDDILAREDFEVTVDHVDVKVKWATIHFTDGSHVRVEANTEHTVRRLEQTDAEKDAEMLKFKNASIARSIAKAPEELKAAHDKLVEYLQYRPSNHDHMYESYVNAQTQAALWAEIAKIHAHESFEGDLNAAAQEVVEQTRTELIEARRASRSTSVMANAVEDAVFDAKASWLRWGRWSF